VKYSAIARNNFGHTDSQESQDDKIMRGTLIVLLPLTDSRP